MFRCQENDCAASQFPGGNLQARKLNRHFGQRHLCFVRITEQAQDERSDILDNLGWTG